MSILNATQGFAQKQPAAYLHGTERDRLAGP